jgi:pimeloyl-ACP methyl ester carboxylesterase
VVPLLQAEGHRAVTPSLTGLGEKAQLLSADIDLDTHVGDVTAVVDGEDLSDVVLVGHSYAGMVITGAAERCHRRIRRLVYLDALVPAHGKSAFDINSEAFRAQLEADAKENGEGYKLTPWSTEALGISNPDDIVWVSSNLGPHPIGSLRQAVQASDHVPLVSRDLHPLYAVRLRRDGGTLPGARLAGAGDRQRPRRHGDPAARARGPAAVARLPVVS